MDKVEQINVSKEILSLVEKAAKATDSNDALKFSQAACNVANAACAGNAANGMVHRASTDWP